MEVRKGRPPRLPRGEMIYDATRHHRRSIRLPAYDYAQAGAYFVTIVTHQRECAFGDVVDGEMVLNEPGRMVEAIWRELPQHYPGVEVDAFVVMPNHVHGIIMLVGAGPRACPDNPGRSRGVAGQPRGVAPTGTMSLLNAIRQYIADNPLRWAEDRENPANVGEPKVGAHSRAFLRDPDV